MKRYRSLLVFSVAGLAACSLAPDYKPPEMPVSSSYKESGDWMAAQPADAIPRGSWWEIFDDPQLNALENKATEANQNIKVALAQYQEARAAADAANADLFPTVTGGADASRLHSSGNAANRSSVRYYNDFLLQTDVSYEIDVWGRVRNAVAAAEHEAEASQADLAAVSLSLHAELAADYFALRGDDAMQVILDKTVEADEQALKLTEDRLNGGIATEAEVDQAETQLENAKTQASDVKLQRAQMEHAIAVLTGQMPADFHLPPMPLEDKAPPLPKPDLPSHLLERRPDIAAAERRTAEANAEIGVARAAYFPTFSLTGALGFESASASHLLSAPSMFWSLGPSAAVTLLDAGRISSLSDEARAAYEAAAANYRQTVLSAYQEVEDNLAAMHHLHDENQSASNAAAAADRALEQEKNLYVGGAATYIDVAVSQTTALQADLAAINIRVRRMTSDVQLVKALGGGWNLEQISK